MQIPPASVLSQWPAPNFTNPETRGPTAIIITAILLGLVTLLLGIRIYTRIWISKGFGLDDVLILLAYVPVAGFAVLSFLAQTKFSWGRHIWDIPFNNITPSLQSSLSLVLLFDVATSLTKLSMLALIYRVVSVDNSRYRYVVIFVAGLVSLDALIFFFITLFQCSPPSAYWTLSPTPQSCINEEKHLLAAGCINTMTDFLIVLVPIPYVRQLKLPRKQQIVIASLFAGGVFATAAGAVRTAVTTMLFNDPLFDITWNAIPVVIATVLELNIGIICASIPPTKPFFTRIFPQLLGNPISWISKCQSQTQGGHGKARSSNMRESLEPDFWLVTKVSDENDSNRDPEAPPLVMTMRGKTQLTGMPTPVRPPRTKSTLRALSAYMQHSRNPSDASEAASLPSRGSVASSRPLLQSAKTASLQSPPIPPIPDQLRPMSVSSQSSYATTIATAILSPSSAPPDLNKPLPTIRSASDLSVRRNGHVESRDATSMNMMSIYQFVPHEDGHISVHKARKSSYSVS